MDKEVKTSKQFSKEGYQNKLFTTEQQNGSGQLNLLDQIENSAGYKSGK